MGLLDSDRAGPRPGGAAPGWPPVASRILVACMLLLGAAAAWLVLTRPVHRIEGDFLEREDRGAADDWLREQLANPVAELRARAYLALSRVQGREAVRELLGAATDPAPSVRAAAAFALGNVLDARLGAAAPPVAAAALEALLADDERVVATRAVEALGKLQWRAAAGSVTRTAAPIVTTMTALIRMGAGDRADFVAEYLDSDDQDSRWAAALAARELQLAGLPAVWERLMPLVTDDNEFVRAAALRAVSLGTPDKALLAAVGEGLEHRDPKVRHEARAALAAFRGAAAPSALPAGEPALGLAPVAPPAEPLLADGDYQRVAKTLGARLRLGTSAGEFDIELDYDQAPLTAEWFRALAASGALDGAPFAAVRPNGYAAALAPLGPVRSELSLAPFQRGSLGLLRAGAASGGGFFICLTGLPLADGRYVNFGRLVSGDSQLDRIAAGAPVRFVRAAP